MTANSLTTDGMSLFSKENSKLLSHLTDILSLLSKNDALTIFLMANDGIKSELDTPSNIGLTKKQYYTRLKQLVGMELLVKHNDLYSHTAFGKVVYQKQILGLTNNIKNSKYLEMVDALKTNPKFSNDDIMSFISKVDPQASVDLDDPLRKFSVVTSSFEDMVSKVLEIMEFAEKEIILISRFTNELIINTIIKKANLGITVKVLADVNLVQGFFDKEGSGTNVDDKNKRERMTVVANPYYPTQISRKYVQVPFCVLIVDNKHVGLEIIDSYNPSKFKTSIFVTDHRLAGQLEIFFNNLWVKASTNPPQIATNI